MKATVYIATSVDGFIARSDGSIDWLEHDSGGNDYGFEAFISTVDAIVMGRHSYEKVLSFGQWPYQVPVVVLSGTLSDEDVPGDLTGKMTIRSETPAVLVESLAAHGAEHLYIDGGKLVQSFLRDGLIDELILSRLPILLGKGIPLFADMGRDIHLEHLSTQTFPSGLVQSKYRVAGSGRAAGSS